MTPKRLSMAIAAAAVATAVITGPVAASNASCTARFAATLARSARPFGRVIVVPEVRNLTLGGPNVGQEVKILLATADRNACPVAP